MYSHIIILLYVYIYIYTIHIYIYTYIHIYTYIYIYIELITVDFAMINGDFHSHVSLQEATPSTACSWVYFGCILRWPLHVFRCKQHIFVGGHFAGIFSGSKPSTYYLYCIAV